LPSPPRRAVNPHRLATCKRSDDRERGSCSDAFGRYDFRYLAFGRAPLSFAAPDATRRLFCRDRPAGLPRNAGEPRHRRPLSPGNRAPYARRLCAGFCRLASEDFRGFSGRDTVASAGVFQRLSWCPQEGDAARGPARHGARSGFGTGAGAPAGRMAAAIRAICGADYGCISTGTAFQRGFPSTGV
jgi:hypothetical protein